MEVQQHEAHRPGLLERGTRTAWKGYQGWRAWRRSAAVDGDHFQVEVETLDGIEQAKLWFARAAMFLGRVPPDGRGRLERRLFLRRACMILP